MAYHHYGAALFAKAQEESDVFGSSVPQQASAPQKADTGEGTVQQVEISGDRDCK